MNYMHLLAVSIGKNIFPKGIMNYSSIIVEEIYISRLVLKE
jgi:hypothetical protein